MGQSVGRIGPISLLSISAITSPTWGLLAALFFLYQCHFAPQAAPVDYSTQKYPPTNLSTVPGSPPYDKSTRSNSKSLLPRKAFS